MASYVTGINNVSQKLDLLEQLVRRACMKQFVTAACAWGALDAEKGKPILKMMDFKANWDCSLICKECACPGRKSHVWAQRENCGRRCGVRSDSFARSYEPLLCEAFVRAFRDKQFRRTFSASREQFR